METSVIGISAKTRSSQSQGPNGHFVTPKLSTANKEQSSMQVSWQKHSRKKGFLQEWELFCIYLAEGFILLHPPTKRQTLSAYVIKRFESEVQMAKI
jgi:hypothetical protein